ncbi:MAG: aldehyde dehydrogenase family protein [Bifidobacterium longum]|nr:aldehyde dehydrogenase family protein [Bifidobacterium longum]
MVNTDFAQLRHAYESGCTRPLAWRRAQLDALCRLVTDNRDAFVAAAMADLGKPAAETILMELNLVAGEAKFVRNRLGLWAARHPKAMHWMLQPAASWTIAEPKGVVLIISPWNYPVLLALEPMADALAAGNAICLKPSELSPNTSRLIAELVPQYLDPAAVRVVEGGPKETGELLKCPFNHIFYTGGGHVGKIVMRAAAEHLTPVTLELGGKSSCFVDRTADINVAARRIAWGKFTNAGQTCVAPDYVLATPDVAEALAERIAVAITEFYGEDPKASPDFGRIINDRHFERLCKLLPVGTVPPEEPSSPLVQVASAVGAAMDMVGRRFNAVSAGRAGAGETAGGGVGGTNNAAKSAAGPNAAAVDGGVAVMAAVEPSEIHKVPGVFDSAGRIVCGGKVDRAARYIAPTVLYGTSPDAPVMGEEIFGPILPILVVEDAESAIRFINKRSRPLAAYVFSRDHEVRLTFERQTSSGALGYSLPLGHLLSSRLPFGGVGASGIGAYHGKAGFLTFSHVKAVVTKPQFPDTLRLVYPPFNEAKAKLFNIIAKFS